MAPDAVLVEQARTGDALAFRRIFDEHAGAVRRFLRANLRDPQAADEATQETFVRAHAHLGRLRDGARLAPWLLGIARRVALEHLRRQRRHVPATEQHERATPELATPEGAVLRREAEEHLERALRVLDEDRRSALLLRVDHGLAYDEIAGVMGWSLPKVKNEIHRARLVLRQELAAYLGGEA